MKDFILSLDAEQDLNEIWEYIASDNPDAADRISQEIYRAIQGLVEMPRKGHTREDLTNKPVLFWAVRSFLVVYSPDTKPLKIVRIIHGARDIRNLL